MIILVVMSVLVVALFGVHVSNKFKLDNQKKLQLNYTRQLGSSVDEYWKSKLEILDRTSESDYLITFLDKQDIGVENAQMLLQSYKFVTGASIVYLMDRNGDVRASSHIDDTQKTLTGNNYSFRPYFTRALLGEVVIYPALGVSTLERGMYLSKAIVSPTSKKVLGVVVFKLSLEHIDRLLAQANIPILLTSPDGIVFAATYDAWLFHSLVELRPSVRDLLKKNRQFADKELRILDKDFTGSTVELDGLQHNIFRYALGIDGWRLFVCNPLVDDFHLEKIQSRFVVLILAFLGLLLSSILSFFYAFLCNKKSEEKLSENWKASERLVQTSKEELNDINSRLEDELADKNLVKANLEKKVKELERFNRVAIEREMRIIELKKEVNALCRSSKKPDRYKYDYNLKRNEL